MSNWPAPRSVSTNQDQVKMLGKQGFMGKLAISFGFGLVWASHEPWPAMATRPNLTKLSLLLSDYLGNEND